ncbi:hypothetical protein FA95DRAFT_1575913, partial [Auriscalpium vulgare]
MSVEAPAQIAAVKGRLQTQREHDRYCAQYGRQLSNIMNRELRSVTRNPKANVPRTVPNWQAVLLQTYGVRTDGWPEEFSKFRSPAELASEGVELGRKKQRADVGGKHARNGILAPVLTPAVVSDADLRDDQFFPPFDPRKEFLPDALPDVIRGMKVLDPHLSPCTEHRHRATLVPSHPFEGAFCGIAHKLESSLVPALCNTEWCSSGTRSQKTVQVRTTGAPAGRQRRAHTVFLASDTLARRPARTQRPRARSWRVSTSSTSGARRFDTLERRLNGAAAFTRIVRFGTAGCGKAARDTTASARHARSRVLDSLIAGGWGPWTRAADVPGARSVLSPSTSPGNAPGHGGRPADRATRGFHYRPPACTVIRRGSWRIARGGAVVDADASSVRRRPDEGWTPTSQAHARRLETVDACWTLGLTDCSTRPARQCYTPRLVARSCGSESTRGSAVVDADALDVRRRPNERWTPTARAYATLLDAVDTCWTLGMTDFLTRPARIRSGSWWPARRRMLDADALGRAKERWTPTARAHATHLGLQDAGFDRVLDAACPPLLYAYVHAALLSRRIAALQTPRRTSGSVGRWRRIARLAAPWTSRAERHPGSIARLVVVARALLWGRSEARRRSTTHRESGPTGRGVGGGAQSMAGSEWNAGRASESHGRGLRMQVSSRAADSQDSTHLGLD